MPVFYIVVAVAGVISLIVGIILIARHFEQQRTEKLRSLAAELGFSFQPLWTDATSPGVAAFEVLCRGRGIKLFNSLNGSSDGVDVTIFDHRYTTGSGKHSHTTTQTVVAIRSDLLKLPRFTMATERLISRIASALGYQDIDFMESPEFSRTFLLRGPDEAAIRAKFSRMDLSNLAEFKGISLEGEGDRLLIWHQGKRRKPEEIRSTFEKAFEVYTLFR